MHRIDLTPVYVLHTRPYSNTSLIVEFFSQHHGRISAVARSARGPQSRYKGQLQLFTPMLTSWSGHHELKTLGNIELSGLPHQLNQKYLFCGFYLNELIIRLLHKDDPHPGLFDRYSKSLCSLEKNEDIPPILRLFEKKLLEELGYALSLTQEAKTRLPIVADNFYRYEHHQGFLRCDEKDHFAFSGNDLLSIAQEKFDTDLTLQATKRLMRLALTHLLGSNPLNSRKFFSVI
ncbi:MAG: DNA repair protein RecO [Gammaproteobacteria bacterium RIFCSPHIGHO2_12_FULL_38_11]|nr:MAG: DNA repair protein RecO [Gammaproteobacteria bacterium RIFCSPHIGHO2_12_FULL_38_11]